MSFLNDTPLEEWDWYKENDLRWEQTDFEAAYQLFRSWLRPHVLMVTKNTASMSFFVEAGTPMPSTWVFV